VPRPEVELSHPASLCRHRAAAADCDPATTVIIPVRASGKVDKPECKGEKPNDRHEHAGDEDDADREAGIAGAEGFRPGRGHELVKAGGVPGCSRPRPSRLA
ncbi:MAG: hypothetical protein ACRDOE_15580, partial [Streptosporangiaceae bacterium]